MRITDYKRRVMQAVKEHESQSEISRALHGAANANTYKALRRLEKVGFVVRDPRYAWCYDWSWFITPSGERALQEDQLELFAN